MTDLQLDKLITVFKNYDERIDVAAKYAFDNNSLIQDCLQGRPRADARLVVPIELTSCDGFYFRGMGYPLDKDTIDILGTYDSGNFPTIETLVTQVRAYINELNQNRMIKEIYRLQYTPAFHTFIKPHQWSKAERVLGFLWSFGSATTIRRHRQIMSSSFRGLTPGEQREFEKVYTISSFN